MDMHILNHDLLPFSHLLVLALHDRGNSRYLDDVFCVARQKINSSDKSNQLQICKLITSLGGLTVTGILLFISLSISITSAAAFHSAFTSVIGWRTNMHRVRYVLHKVEWNSVGADIISTKYKV